MSKSCIKWVGGKSKMANQLITMFPRHQTYVEVFGGAAHVLFTKPQSKLEILNDLDGHLMNFWKVVKYNHQELVDSFQYILSSRELFMEYKRKFKQNDFKDDLEHAHVFFYLNQFGYAGRVKNPSYSTGDKNTILNKLDYVIRESYDRLKYVKIENLDFTKIFEIYDKEDAFYFLDSPYICNEQYQVGKFTEDMYYKLFECCKNSKGKWLYTINDHPFIRNLFKDYNIIENKNVFYSLSVAATNDNFFQELIITNYEVKNYSYVAGELDNYFTFN